MNTKASAGLPIALLAFPSVSLGASISLLAASGWGARAQPWAPAAALIGVLLLMLAFFTALVVAPVGIYTLARDPALRTAGQLVAVGADVIVIGLPVLALYGSGV